MNQWRVGRHYPVHVYEGDRPVATFFREADARQAVEDRAAAMQQSVAVLQFARAVLHGSEEHRAWLLDAAQAFTEGRPLPQCDH